MNAGSDEHDDDRRPTADERTPLGGTAGLPF
jgi:hypothetical protein